jgi:hypothetical protein
MVIRIFREIVTNLDYIVKTTIQKWSLPEATTTTPATLLQKRTSATTTTLLTGLPGSTLVTTAFSVFLSIEDQAELANVRVVLFTLKISFQYLYLIYIPPLRVYYQWYWSLNVVVD